jgi:small subunit ribosomal protein S9
MKTVTAAGKRKSAIARATIRAGKGVVRINNKNLDFYEPKISRLKLREPLIIAGDLSNKVNIDVNVFIKY